MSTVIKPTEKQCRAVTQHALDWVADVGDCLFCTLQGTDVHAWHEDFCPLRNIDPTCPPKRRVTPRAIPPAKEAKEKGR